MIFFALTLYLSQINDKQFNSKNFEYVAFGYNVETNTAGNYNGNGKLDIRNEALEITINGDPNTPNPIFGSKNSMKIMANLRTKKITIAPDLPNTKKVDYIDIVNLGKLYLSKSRKFEGNQYFSSSMGEIISISPVFNSIKIGDRGFLSYFTSKKYFVAVFCTEFRSDLKELYYLLEGKNLEAIASEKFPNSVQILLMKFQLFDDY